MDALVSAGLLFSTLWLFKIRKLTDAVGIIAFQSALLALVAAIMWYKTGIDHLLVAAALTFAIKTILIPLILFYTIKRTNDKQAIERRSSPHVSLLLAILLAVAGYYVATDLRLPGTQHGEHYIASSIILIFLGTFTMIEHKKAIMQAIGLIVIENGIFLITESITYGMPLVVELGILFDLLVSAVVIAVLAFRIHSSFDSLNTDKMQNLRG